jgi:hypothetical protein
MKVNDTTALTGSVNANVTGATLELHLKKPDGTVVDKTPTVTNALTGAWTSGKFAAGEIDIAGLWYVEVEVTYSGGAVQTFGPARWRVGDQIA